MKILFDHGTPVPLRDHLAGHEVSTAYEMGWATLRNGDLLTAAEKEFTALLTTDKNLRYQQNLTGRQLAILVLRTTSWPRLQKRIPEIIAAVNALKPGDYIELNFGAQS
jgi:predicted nuclease of predicted toxin-antitoxin system